MIIISGLDFCTIEILVDLFEEIRRSSSPFATPPLPLVLRWSLPQLNSVPHSEFAQPCTEHHDLPDIYHTDIKKNILSKSNTATHKVRVDDSSEIIMGRVRLYILTSFLIVRSAPLQQSSFTTATCPSMTDDISADWPSFSNKNENKIIIYNFHDL